MLSLLLSNLYFGGSCWCFGCSGTFALWDAEAGGATASAVRLSVVDSLVRASTASSGYVILMFALVLTRTGLMCWFDSARCQAHRDGRVHFEADRIQAFIMCYRDVFDVQRNSCARFQAVP